MAPILASRAAVESSPVLWNIVERHLDESEFLFEQWQNAFRSPCYDLLKLASTVERRLLAHLNGLRLGGPAVVERLLAPALLEAQDPARVAVAALGILEGGVSQFQTVFSALEAASPDIRAAIARALVLSEQPAIDAALLRHFAAASEENTQAVFLEILTSRRTDPGPVLNASQSIKTPRLKRALLEAIRCFSHEELLPFAEDLLASEMPAVRMSAIKTGLAFGSARAWDTCFTRARPPETCEPDALMGVAMFGDRKDHQVLYDALELPRRAEAALWALSFAGTDEAIEACLPVLSAKNSRAAKLAADAIAWIGGFDAKSDEFRAIEDEPSEEETLPPFEDDHSDGDLCPDGVDDLPLVKPDAIKSWWDTHQMRFTLHSRLLRGQPFSGESLLQALQTAPLWRRHALALELSVRTRGRLSIPTESFSRRQRSALATAIRIAETKL